MMAKSLELPVNKSPVRVDDYVNFKIVNVLRLTIPPQSIRPHG
jgi:hypothetical protein